MLRKKLVLALALIELSANVDAKDSPLITPPMGWMSWNLLAGEVDEQILKEMANALVSSGMKSAGYNHIFIDDGWQGGRDNQNNIIADKEKFPSGIGQLAEFMHERGLKLGIYSDAAQLTCAGYTGSLHFEIQDAKTIASWGIDYLKYDYCNAPEDAMTAQQRYRAMADALKVAGRTISFSVCEWGDRKPWTWASGVGANLWRTTADVRDKWQTLPTNPDGVGIMDILDINSDLAQYARSGNWNDPDMLVVGLYGHNGPAALLGGSGMNDLEYQSQFSLWAMMNAPLYASNDIRKMNEATKAILLNKEIISLNQDGLGRQAQRLINENQFNVFVKPLVGGEYAVAILNRGDKDKRYNLDFSRIGLQSSYQVRDLVRHKSVGKNGRWSGLIKRHETVVLRLSASDEK